MLTSLLSCLFEDERGWKREKGATSVPPSHGLSRTPVQLLDRITSTAFLIEYLSHGPWKEHAAQAGMNTADQTALGTAVEAMAAMMFPAISFALNGVSASMWNTAPRRLL